MITCIFDTETTGLPNKNLPVDHPDQARIVQLAALLLSDDNEVGCFYSRFQPDAWPPIHPKAYEAHKLSVLDCADCGISAAVALQVFNSFVGVADVVVAHNYKFDVQLIDIELGRAMIQLPPAKPSYCTMEALTPIMGLRRANGAPKWPNLAEALEFCAPGTVFDKAHDALADVRATAKVWKWLNANGHTVSTS